MKKLGYVSLFSSAGIGCYGFKQLDFECVATTEIIERRINIQKFNHVAINKEAYINEDMSLQSTKEKVINLVEEWKINNNRDYLDVLISTPPCQGMSVANHKKKEDEIKRNSLIVDSINLVAKLKPNYFIFENVPSFLNTLCTDNDGNDKPIEEAINKNLSSEYNILSKVINFADYGSNSSRPRTLVIGIKKKYNIDISPVDLFPTRTNPPSLKKLIGDLPSLKYMGKIQHDDIFHSFKRYKEHMYDWVVDLKEGESAFSNKDKKRVPHQIINGKYKQNQNKNGDKYRRTEWNKLAPCVHTRNDILASQNTIHPSDPRVFSIRELMRFLSIPKSFKWSDIPFSKLNKLSIEEKEKFLRHNEINIRQCLGEAVPTEVFKSIAKKIYEIENYKFLKESDIKKIIKNNQLYIHEKLLRFIKESKLSFVELSKIAELANSQRLNNAAYYTNQELSFNVVNSAPEFKKKSVIHILEPSVGVGNFLPSLFLKYDKQNVCLDVIDINIESIKTLKSLLRKIKIPSNFKINFINEDFVLFKNKKNYDLVIGNPPFENLRKEQIDIYRYDKPFINNYGKNIYSFFLTKSLLIGKNVSLISPKALLESKTFLEDRVKLRNKKIFKITDYGEFGFKGVKVETISLHVRNQNFQFVEIESYPLQKIDFKKQSYIIDDDFPTWLIYRNSYFDSFIDKLEFNQFVVIRDRRLTSKNYFKNGLYKVIKSKNIGYGSLNFYSNDLKINSSEFNNFIHSYLNKQNYYLVPNLTYYPRIANLPKNTVVDGSAAILFLKNGKALKKYQLDFFNSFEFFYFYRVARNFSTRSLNVDSTTVFYFGLLKNKLKLNSMPREDRSSLVMQSSHQDMFELHQK